MSAQKITYITKNNWEQLLKTKLCKRPIFLTGLFNNFDIYGFSLTYEKKLFATKYSSICRN